MELVHLVFLLAVSNTYLPFVNLRTLQMVSFLFQFKRNKILDIDILLLLISGEYDLGTLQDYVFRFWVLQHVNRAAFFRAARLSIQKFSIPKMYSSVFLSIITQACEIGHPKKMEASKFASQWQNLFLAWSQNRCDIDGKLPLGHNRWSDRLFTFL